MSNKKRNIYKVSPSLLNSYLNMKNKKYPNSTESFMDTLNRIPLKMNYFLERGNDFENRVTKYKSEPFHAVIKGCDTQVYVEKMISLPDESFDVKMLGFVDFVSKDRKLVYDTKRVNYWNDEKYDASVQHDFYMWAIPESETFYYLVGEGKKWISTGYYQVEYPKLKDEETEKLFRDLISEFLTFLKENNLLDIYKEHYNATRKKNKKDKAKGDDK